MSRCLAALFLLAFASYLALMTPFVQTRLVTYFADLLGKRLGTEIVIGKVDFRPIESLVLSDVYVKGFANDTLLYCRRLTARVDSVSFVRRRATVTELDFDGAVFNLWVSRDSAGSRTNVEMLLDPLSREGAGSSRPGSPGWRVSLERIRLRNSRFRYMEDQYEPVEYGINWTDVDCRGLDADISGISFDGGTYAAEVSGLRFCEKSGFRVNRMGGRVVIRKDNMLITSADISTDKSFIHLDSLRYDWVPDRKYWKYFVHKMRQRYVFSNTAVNFDDLAYFNGRLLGMENTVSGSGVVTGTIDSLSGERLDLALGDTTRLCGSFRSRGLPRIFETDFDITLDDCLASPAELERLYLPWIDPHYLDFPDPVHKIGAYRLAIDFKGRLEDFVVEAESGTFGALGSVRLAYEADSAAYRYSGGMDMRRIDCGLFTGLSALGGGSLRGTFEGEGGDSLSCFDLEACVSRLALFDGRLRGVFLDLGYRDGRLSLSSLVDDPRVRAGLSLDGFFSDSLSSADIRGFVDVEEWDGIGPALLGEDESFAAAFSGSLGETPDDSRWEIRLDSLRYANTLGSFALDSARMENLVLGKYRYLLVESGLLDATIGGFFDYGQYDDLWNHLLYNYFPAYELARDAALPENMNVAFQAELKDVGPLLRVAWPWLRVAGKARLSGGYDYAAREIRLEAEADTLAVGDLRLRAPGLSIAGRGKQMRCVCRADEMAWAGIGAIYNVRDVMRVGWNRCDNDLSWSNWHERSYCGTLSASLRLLEYNGRHMAQVNVYPGVIVLADSVWNVERSVVLWEDKNLFVNNFEIRRGEQCFRLRGRLGDNERDVLALEFDRFDLAEFDALLSDKRLGLFGSIDGSVSLRDFYGDRLVYADVRMDDWGLARDTLGTLRMSSYWDAPSKALRIGLENTMDGRVPIALSGLYKPSADSLDARLRLSAIGVEHVAAYFPDVTRGGKGSLSGDLRLVRHAGKAAVDGALRLDSVSLFLSALNTAFTVDDTLVVRGNRLLLDGLRVLDAEGRRADCSGFYDWETGRYDAELRFHNFKILDTPPRQDGSFYGRLHVSGLARAGNLSGTDALSLSLRPEARSLLCVPLSVAAEEEDGNFLRFVGSGAEVAAREDAGREGPAWVAGVDLDANLEINDNLEVQLVFDPTIGDVLTTVGSGDIKVSLDKDQTLNLFGEYRVERGDYLFTLSNLLNKKFVLTPGGTIAWNGSPYDATIDVSAVYNLKTSLGDLLSGTTSTLERNVKVPVECVLRLSERLSNPAVQFAIDFPSLDGQMRSLLQSLFSSQDEINKQVFALMIMNKFYTPDYLDGDPAQQERNAGYQMGVTTASELLSNQLSRWLSQISSNLDVGFSYRPGDELTANEFELALSTQLFDDRVTVSANGNMQEKAKTNSNTAITGDFDVDVKLNRQGTLRLKAYSHTDEKIIYNATETVQGIGVSYRETFDTLRELWRKYAALFRRKDRPSSSGN